LLAARELAVETVGSRSSFLQCSHVVLGKSRRAGMAGSAEVLLWSAAPAAWCRGSGHGGRKQARTTERQGA